MNLLYVYIIKMSSMIVSIRGDITLSGEYENPDTGDVYKFAVESDSIQKRTTINLDIKSMNKDIGEKKYYAYIDYKSHSSEHYNEQDLIYIDLKKGLFKIFIDDDFDTKIKFTNFPLIVPLREERSSWGCSVS